MAQPKYILRFFFEWQCDECLWCANHEETYKKYDVGSIDSQLFKEGYLNQEIVDKIAQMAAWHDTSLNWEYPLDPSPWKQEECDRFEAEVQLLITEIRTQLGSEFDVIDKYHVPSEDPDLARYNLDPKKFKRKEKTWWRNMNEKLGFIFNKH